MTRHQFLALLRWEKGIEINSYLPKGEAVARLGEKIQPFFSWSILHFFRPKKPLLGSMTGYEGIIQVRDVWPSAPSGRALSFILEEIDGGSRLRGVLHLRISLFFYECAGLAFMCFTELSTIYWALVTKRPLNLGLARNLLTPLLAIPFLWCYIRFGLWFGRKREAELINIVQITINPVKIPSPSASQARSVSTSTPTEVFIRPRKSLDH